MDRKSLLDQFSCPLPCVYNEYKILEEIVGTAFNGFAFAFGSNQVLQRKEQLVYDFTSFVSEVGGALGLFVGFSFVMFWETTVSTILRIIGFMQK